MGRSLLLLRHPNRLDHHPLHFFGAHQRFQKKAELTLEKSSGASVSLSALTFKSSNSFGIGAIVTTCSTCSSPVTRAHLEIAASEQGCRTGAHRRRRSSVVAQRLPIPVGSRRHSKLRIWARTRARHFSRPQEFVRLDSRPASI